MKTTTCQNESCGALIEYEPLVFRGREVGSQRYCDECIARWGHEEEQRAEDERFRERLDRSGLPQRLHNLSLPDNEVGRLGRAWADGEIGGLCLTGPVGVGKTYAAAAACWLRLQRAGCRWVSVARLMVHLRAGFGDEERAAAVRTIAGEGPIILDDLDKVNPTEYGREVIFAAIDGRVEAGAPLLVTTNLGPEEIGERLGDAVKSRLVGYCETVRMVGADRRVAS